MIDEHHPLDLKGIYCLGVLPAIERAQQQIPTAVPLRLYDIRLDELKICLCTGPVSPSQRDPDRVGGAIEEDLNRKLRRVCESMPPPGRRWCSASPGHTAHSN